MTSSDSAFEQTKRLVNWKRGLWRAYAVLTAAWIIVDSAAIVYLMSVNDPEADRVKSMVTHFFPKLFQVLTGYFWFTANAWLFGPPLVLLAIGLAIGWIVRGFSRTNYGA